jgi:hypothetical protein
MKIALHILKIIGTVFICVAFFYEIMLFISAFILLKK